MKPVKEVLHTFTRGIILALIVMMILTGLELLESIRTYLSDELLHVEVVFLVAMIAIARKVIILEVKDLDPLVRGVLPASLWRWGFTL